jgi:hypothetical protein
LPIYYAKGYYFCILRLFHVQAALFLGIVSFQATDHHDPEKKGDHMNTDHHRKTATIYAFPLRPRMSSRNGISEQEINRIKNYVDCSSWYHQDAIEESKEAGPVNGPRQIS